MARIFSRLCKLSSTKILKMCTREISNTRVAVIGAGPSGVSVLRAFQSAKDKGANMPEIVCFERQSDWGGMWKYTWRTGTNEYGEPVHCSMYRYLWTNSPKECLEFVDYTFEEHFGRPIASYPPRSVVADYVNGRFEKSNVRENIRFHTPVRMVEYSQEKNTFKVTVNDLVHDQMYSEDFDFVVIATGRFSTPNVPNFEGLETFNGRVLHSHDFRDALEFKGKDVLIIGTSFSAEDIASQCYKYGAKSITCSHRSSPMGYQWPNNFKEVPLLTRVDKNTCYFKDGSSTEVDAIVMCTGYLHHFPYLTDELRLKMNNRLWPVELYKGIFWEPNPKLMYLGMQTKYYTFNMFDVQAQYARDHILGRIALPDREKMSAHSQAWRDRNESLKNTEQEIRFQGEYIKELISEIDFPEFDIEGVNETFIQWARDKREDIMGFRDRSHTSLVTGKPQPKHHTPWLDAMDDSLKSYLGHP